MSRSIYLRPWRVDITIRDGVAAPVSAAALGRAMVRAAEAAGAPSPASIGLILSGDAELTTLNAAHLGNPRATDVLSFPCCRARPFPGTTARRRGRPGGCRASRCRPVGVLTSATS